MPLHVRPFATMLALVALSVPALSGCTPSPPPALPTSAAPSATATTGDGGTPAPALEKPTAAPVLETETFPGSGDISDDSAIWVDPADPGNSLVVADNKATSGGGIGLFDMNGKMVHFRPDGMIGNVDLRAGFPASGSSTVLVGGNNRTDNTLALWSLDPATRTLAPVAARSIATEAPNYGFCMYHSRASGKFYAFVTPNGAGSVQQFELAADSTGKVDATPVRTLPVSSITESCVADDELGHLYVGQEGVGIWKYGAEPDAGTERTSVDAVGDGRLEADVEGMSIAYGADGAGYLFVSSQGDSTIAIYDRAGSNAFLKSFKVAGNGDVDGVTGTDGLAATMENVGPRFEQGMLVVHDEANSGADTSNLKYVPLSDVLK
ncbi:phytase [Pseudarthrobacter sp. 1C304]|uniref:phytase n=1 Tax=Pseudarthrobacter sp. 1C304 TaxID=3457438 RepID=UPI003FD18D08